MKRFGKRPKSTPIPKECEAVIAGFGKGYNLIQTCGKPAVAVVYDSERVERAVCAQHRKQEHRKKKG